MRKLKLCCSGGEMHIYQHRMLHRKGRQLLLEKLYLAGFYAPGIKVLSNLTSTLGHDFGT